MKYKWMLSSNYINGIVMYRVYRLIDPCGIDHSGNREYAGEYITDRDEAMALRDKLNAEGAE